MGKLISAILLFLTPFISFSQQVKVDGYFLQDSAKLGERVGYVLKASYPESVQLIFPDSTFDYSPFVLLEKQTFTSQTVDGVTLDSAVYYLSNFDLEPSAFLSLPIYELAKYDSVVNYPLEAELKLKLTLDSIPEELSFQHNNVYQPLERSINWLLLGVIIGAVLILAGIIYYFFSDHIHIYLKERRHKKRWGDFRKKWTKLTNEFKESPSIETADKVAGLWKTYMESITEHPYGELTSSEIAEVLQNKQVFTALRAIDLVIYAGSSDQTQEATDYLLEVAQENYQQKQSNIKHERAAV